ncbi:ribosome silencing factor [Hydrogenophaga sp. RWCD_12]|uniref:ribosome silencing factor n=1 Tax=Hydrogenophaga sp. RWCD_12 TaxID=3391190 RepID=UPI003984978C
MTSETTAKKDIQKLQRAIVEGLEDVKGQDIVVFNTEALSPLFERVIVASGTSNRQTKALASSVRDAVREAGFDKPRIEGEDNGEWIIIDCGAAVAHVMQPVIRQYYRLEEIWGQKPVKLKSGAEKAAAARSAASTEPKKSVKKAAKKSTATKEVAPVSGKAVVRKTAKAVAPVAAKAPAKKVAGKSPAKPVASKAPRKTATSGAKPKAALPKLVVNKPKPAAKPAAKTAAKPAAKKSAPKKKA